MAMADDVEGIRGALVGVVAEWTQSDLQVRVAERLDSPLDATEIRALYLVGAAGGSVGFGPLAEGGNMSRPTASKLVSRMSAKGLFDRVRSGRLVEVRLTDAGHEAYGRLVAAGQQMVADALTDWSAHEIEQFRRQLIRFVVAMPGATLASTTPGPHTTPSPQEES